MKRRQRRPVLELNQSQAGSHGDHVQNKRKQAALDYHGQNVPGNPLANLLCHYNSDSDTEDAKKDICKLDDQVNNFLKEIQLIAPKQPIANEFGNNVLNSNAQLPQHINQQASMWRECIDESSGYPYYWHIETNEVTWEMPEELRYTKNNAKGNSAIKPHSMQDPHWVDFSSVAYQSHENIPEGMIPREVVARNRNRYIRNETTKKQELPADQDITNTSDTMDNESDDGKIEMITSYGSEESDSDTADEGQSKDKASAGSVVESVNVNSTIKSKVETFSSSMPVKHPPILKRPLDQDSRDSSDNPKTEVLDTKIIEEKDTKYSKNQVKEPEESIERPVRECKAAVNEISGKSNTDFDFRVSLVPGYDEDSEPEEELEVRQERKALFPIPQTEESADNTLSLKMHRIPESNDSDGNDRRNVQELDNEVVSEKTDSEESVPRCEDDGQKTNKFLDNLHGRSKFFQRKKRIAFDVPSTKKKPVDKEESKPEPEVQQEEVAPDSSERTDELRSEHQEEQNAAIAEDKVEDAVDTMTEPGKAEEEAVAVTEVPADSKEDEGEVALLSQIILEKLKFLSEGKPTVSPVQMMSIQLQTLFVAWEGGYLEKSYLRRWLTDTSHELERLEQDAAPPGWLCQWDRSHKRYYYQNTATGVTQWIYPDTGIAGGAEEMEICSTPPPMEQDEMIATAVEEEEGLKSKPKKQPEDNDASEDTTLRNPDVEAPPPPQISNPSPPPPPRIYGNDMKKDKRKREKGSDILDSKKQRIGKEGIVEVNHLENTAMSSHSATSLSPQPNSLTNIANVTNVEPLPPGVDLTEAPYELPASALKRIIYSAVQPQGSALYDAAVRDPTVPILSHPAAIVQEHYLQYPAYQHLHSSAAIVLPHKHGVQPTIQIIPDYTPIYTNHKVIEKPPIKTAKESLVSALDSFYSDIARIENSRPEKAPQRQDTVTTESSLPVEEAKVDMEMEALHAEVSMKEKKKKKARVGISKKHKEVSSMVAKWQKVQQNFENT